MKAVRLKWWLLCLIVTIAEPSIGFSDSIDEEIAMIQEQIQINGLNWTAGRTWPMELTREERGKLCGLVLPKDYVEPESEADAPLRTYPSRFDWRDSNDVSPVKNQFNCGSCWAFAPLAALESMVMITSGWTPDLSEQQMVSCNNKGYSCNGGWLDIADHFVNPGCVYESCMPYQASDGVTCIEESCGYAVQAQSWRSISNNVDSIKNALIQGPVACAMHVYNDFYAYKSGCYEHAGSEAVDHGVLIVGWDDSICGGAWIVKNSWGPRWGENGFGYVKFNSSRIGVGALSITYEGSGPQATATPIPYHSPTPLPTAAPAYSLVLSLTKPVYHAAESLNLTISFTNQGIQSTSQFYLMLEYAGQYFFFPDWNQEPNGIWLTVPDYYQDSFEILRLSLPYPLSPGGPFRFHAACIWPETVYLASNVSSVEFYFE